MKSRWKIIARHKWVLGATITESYLDDPAVNLRRFTATIRGWRNWKMYEGVLYHGLADKVAERVREIRDRIDAGDESVFNENQVFPEEVK